MNVKRAGLLLVVMLWTWVAVAACGGREKEVVRVTETNAPAPTAGVTVTPMAESPTAAPVPQATATLPEGSATTLPEIIPTDTPIPSSTPIPEPSPGGGVLDDLDKELFVSLGGGDGAFCTGAPAGPLPLAEGEVFEYHFGHLCLWGFPAGGVASVELYDPSGQLVASKEVTIDDERDGVGVVQLLLWFAGQPTGEWTVVADSAGMRVQVPYRVGEPDLPVISIVPPGSDLFDGDRWLHWWTLGTDSGAGQAAIFGAGFPPGSSLPLGIYYQTKPDGTIPAELVYGREVQTDEQGRFEVHMAVEALALQGDGVYYAIVPLDPSYEPRPGALDPLGAMAGFMVGSGADDAGSVTLMLTSGGGRLDDPTVRQAIVAAVNRLHLSETFGGAQVTFLFSFQGEVIDPAAEPWDPNLARQLLAEAGYAGGANAEFVYPDGDPELAVLAWSIADNLANVGLPVQLVPISPADIDGQISVMLAAGEPVFWLARW